MDLKDRVVHSNLLTVFGILFLSKDFLSASSLDWQLGSMCFTFAALLRHGDPGPQRGRGTPGLAGSPI